MNCQTCQADLEDLLYGELDTAWKIALHEHLSVCSACREIQLTLERENQLFANFYEQTTWEPQETIWQAIRTRIQPEPETPPAVWWAKLRQWSAPFFGPALLRQAGFAVILVLLSVGLTALYFSARKQDDSIVKIPSAAPPNSSATPSLPAPVSTPAPSVKVVPRQQLAVTKSTKSAPKLTGAVKLSDDDLLTQQIAKATREYQSAIHLLERTIAKRKTQMDTETIKQFEGSLALIDASITSSRAALRAHPNDPSAARFLLSAYSKKVEFMQEIAMR